jgi:4-amino-4-deoxy-L-arabinose transferase-like glycosyltransferase
MQIIKSNIILITLVIGYLITHLLGLLELPVFADEAIYIRWSQLIIDDLPRYLFFAMNDGKTPLFFWILAPFQYLFSDQLFSARFVAVMIGLAQMLIIMKITSLLTKNKKTIYLSGLLVMILPFWYFHHRMALTDGLMTLMISGSMYFLINEFVVKQKSKNILFSGICFGLALLAKIPAILFIPSYFILILLIPNLTKKNIFGALIKIILILTLGGLIFLSLIISPSFIQLFNRSGDFLFPLAEILSGRWLDTIPSLPVYFGYFVVYMTPTLVLIMLMGLFAHKNKVIVHVFFWTGILFLLPIALMGKVVYPRYLFPAVLNFTLASVFAIEDLFIWIKKFKNKSSHLLLTGFLVLMLSNTVANSGIFIFTSINNHTQIPFVSSDVVQYLTEWSSGHGLFETSQLIKKEAQNQTIAVATEGYFGSLPDGLNLYFHNEDVSNIAIDGVGYPVNGVSKSFAIATQNFERKWLVVNSHRLNIRIDEKYLINEYCRPFNAPCLQVWDITDIFDTLILD